MSNVSVSLLLKHRVPLLFVFMAACFLNFPLAASAYTLSDVVGTWYTNEGFKSNTNKIIISSDASCSIYELAREQILESKTTVSVSGNRIVVTQTWGADDPETLSVYEGTITILTSGQLCILFDGESSSECWVTDDPRATTGSDTFESAMDWDLWNLAQGSKDNFMVSEGRLQIQTVYNGSSEDYKVNSSNAKSSRGFNKMSIDMALINVHGNSWGAIGLECFRSAAGERWYASFGLQTDNDDVDGVMTAQVRAQVEVESTTGTEKINCREVDFAGKGVYQNFSIHLDEENNRILFYLDDLLFTQYNLPSGASFLPTVDDYLNGIEKRSNWQLGVSADQNYQSPSTPPTCVLNFDNVKFDWGFSSKDLFAPAVLNLLLP